MSDLSPGYVYVHGPNTDRWMGWTSPQEAAAAGSRFNENWEDDFTSVIEHAMTQFRQRTAGRAM